MVVTDGKHHEAGVVKERSFPLQPDSIVSVDRGYLDFKWLYSLILNRVSFVTRAKKNFKYEFAGQHEEPKDRYLDPQPQTSEENQDRTDPISAKFPRTVVIKIEPVKEITH